MGLEATPNKGLPFKRVLIIDSNDQHLKVIAGSLQRLLGDVAIDTLNPAQTSMPTEDYDWQETDLLVADMGRDKINTKEWFINRQAASCLPPTILVDASASSDDAVDLMRHGAVDYLNKRGLSDSRLLQALEAAELVHYKREQDQTQQPIETTGVIQADKIREVTDRLDVDDVEEDSERNYADDSSMSWFKLPSISDDFPIRPEDIMSGIAKMGDYRILEFLGAGGSTQVFKAESIRQGGFVAVKVLSPARAGGEQSRDRFLREYELVKDIDSPNIIHIYEQFSNEEWPYMVMEYCARGDLKSRMQRKLPAKTAARYAAQIAAGLHAAHEAGLVHRDIKPTNILFREDNSLVLVDFGIVKSRSPDQQAMTDEGRMVGTPYYMSPEQARGGKLDGRSDLYALGVILFEMLEGRRPFTGDTPIDVIFSHVQDPVPPLTQTDERLVAVVEKLLAKDRDDRYASGMEVVNALQEIFPEEVESILQQAS